jgi:mevalonate pyrophosphate decarboxylase
MVHEWRLILNVRYWRKADIEKFATTHRANSRQASSFLRKTLLPIVYFYQNTLSALKSDRRINNLY